MLVEAISLLVGGRADPSIVRTGATEARVEGRFVRRRRRARRRPGRARRGPVARLHRRTAGHRCAARRARRTDRRPPRPARPPEPAVGSRPARRPRPRRRRRPHGPAHGARPAHRDRRRAGRARRRRPRTRLREVDLLRFQLAELEAAELDDPDEDDDAGRSCRTTLADAVEHRTAGLRAAALLADDDGGRRPRRRRARRVERPGAVRRTRRPGCAPSPPSSPTSPPSCGTRAEAIDEDPERLAAIGERRQLLARPAAQVRRLARRGDRLPRRHSGAPRRAGGLRRARRRARGAARSPPWPTNVARRRAVGAAAPRRCRRLGPAVEEHLRALAMPHAALTVAVGDDDPGDDVVIVLAANPGSPPLPLARAASGGELARTMLALRLVLSEAPDTLVFDEVDAGIGGAAAVAVGESLAALGRAPSGARRHPPAAGGRAGRRADRRRQADRRRADDHQRAPRWTARSARRRWRGCCPARRPARQPDDTPPSSSASAHAARLNSPSAGCSPPALAGERPSAPSRLDEHSAAEHHGAAGGVEEVVVGRDDDGGEREERVDEGHRPRPAVRR